MSACAIAALLGMTLAASSALAKGALSDLQGSGGNAPVDAPAAPTAAVALSGDGGGCDLRPYVLAAVKKVGSCLAGLNGEMTGKIKEGIDHDRFEFVCGDAVDTEGGRTEHEVDPVTGALVSATITIRMKAAPSASGPPIAQSSPEARVFHELIHAVDPAGRYILGAGEHKERGFPDAVYGCHFACYKDMTSEDVKVLDVYERSHGDVPEQAPCSEDKENDGNTACSALQKYRYLCRTGKPYMDAADLRATRVRQLPTCVIEKLINECRDVACLSLRQKVEDDAARADAMAKALGQPITGRPSGTTLASLSQQGQRLAAAWKGDDVSALSADDLGLYQAAKRGQRSLFDACLK